MKKLWPMEKVKELDFPSPTGFLKVGDFLPTVIEEVKADYSTQYSVLKKSLSENGQTVPLLVSKDYKRLRDGIHRVALASELNWNYMFVSAQRYDNSDWDNSEIGAEYWRLWNWRLNGFTSKDG